MLRLTTLSIVILLAMSTAASAQILTSAGEPQLPLYQVGSNKNPVLAWALSAALPGLGQFYNGQPQKGALQLGMTLFFVMAAAEYQDLPEVLGVSGLVGTWVWSMITRLWWQRPSMKSESKSLSSRGLEVASSVSMGGLNLEVKVFLKARTYDSQRASPGAHSESMESPHSATDWVLVGTKKDGPGVEPSHTRLSRLCYFLMNFRYIQFPSNLCSTSTPVHSAITSVNPIITCSYSSNVTP